MIAGAEGLLAREKKIFPASARKFLELALRRAVQFSEATGAAASSAAWRGKLDAFNAAEAARKATQPATPHTKDTP